jgi:hypothetical protein
MKVFAIRLRADDIFAQGETQPQPDMLTVSTGFDSGSHEEILTKA